MVRLANTIEAILYLKAKPLTLGQIAEYAGCDRDTAEEGLIELMGDYAHREGALEIAETEKGYSLQLKAPYKPLVNELIPLDIGLGALRTLAAIAMRGPISQTDLVELRGSGAYQHVPDLVDQGFVRKRRQSDGRSYWLQVTEKFYQRFEIDKLPEIGTAKTVAPLSPDADDPEVAVETVTTDTIVMDTVATGAATLEAIVLDAAAVDVAAVNVAAVDAAAVDAAATGEIEVEKATIYGTVQDAIAVSSPEIDPAESEEITEI